MDYAPIEAQLRKRMIELQQRLEKIKSDVTQPHSSDFAEQAQERENDEVLDQIGNETRAAIQQINAALQRVSDGTYGDCDRCGEEIDVGRLEIIPETTRCVNCAE